MKFIKTLSLLTVCAAVLTLNCIDRAISDEHTYKQSVSSESITYEMIANKKTNSGTTVNYGDCGEGLTWTLSDDGVLTVNGTGAMTSAPWRENDLQIKQVILSDGVENILEGAFELYFELESITIPNTVKNIEKSAFEYCGALSSVIIPDSVESIESYAFEGCLSLASVTIGNGLKTVGDQAFYNSSVENVYISDISGWCAVNFSDLYANPLYNGAALYLDGDKVDELCIPDDVTSIGNWAFSGCSSIVSLEMHNGVTSIGAAAMRYCSNLSSVILSDRLVNIENSVFEGCEGLETVDIPEGVENIGWDAFENCTHLSSITVPASVKNIGDYAFFGCSALENVLYTGTTEQWENVYIGEENDALKNAEIAVLTDVSIDTLPRVLYVYGEELSLDGLVLNKICSDGSVIKTDECTVTGYDRYAFGEQALTVTHNGFECSFKVWVKPAKTNSFTAPLAVGTTVEEFAREYSADHTVYVFDTDKSTLLSLDDTLKTGCVAQIICENSVAGSVAVIVNGDTNGDGIINGKDLIRLKKQLMEQGAVEYPEFADINQDGKTDENDIGCLVEMI